MLEIPIMGLDGSRNMVVGMINGKCWTAITTMRGNNIRLISVRRSRETEVSLYEGE